MKHYALVVFDVDGTLVRTKSETLYVDDRPIDEARVKNAGVDFSRADAFFHEQT